MVYFLLPSVGLLLSHQLSSLIRRQIVQGSSTLFIFYKKNFMRISSLKFGEKFFQKLRRTRDWKESLDQENYFKLVFRSRGQVGSCENVDHPSPRLSRHLMVLIKRVYCYWRQMIASFTWRRWRRYSKLKSVSLT